MYTPEMTYIVICHWADGEVLTREAALNRDAAFDEASEAFESKDIEYVSVFCIEMGKYGPRGVADVTGQWRAERVITQPELTERESDGDAADRAYEDRRSQQHEKDAGQ